MSTERKIIWEFETKWWSKNYVPYKLEEYEYIKNHDNIHIYKEGDIGRTYRFESLGLVKHEQLESNRILAHALFGYITDYLYIHKCTRTSYDSLDIVISEAIPWVEVFYKNDDDYLEEVPKIRKLYSEIFENFEVPVFQPRDPIVIRIVTDPYDTDWE